jgi:flagellar M-ring protein FliF
MNNFWTRLDTRARIGLAGGAFAIVLVLAGSAVWLLRTDYKVLFADLKPQDSAAMVAELERQKVPYQIAGDGNTLLVPADMVHATRLKLMGREIPLQGAAGFELFNNADFGMTEFAQKINYQRALQGELTRTILSLAEVRDARVHLALAEEGLFKRAQARGKAAITLTLKPGASLRGEQVVGIQRLVAAAVPGIAAADVTIVDQRGVALTRTQADGEIEHGSARLDLKKETEQLLARKAGEVLERALGAGQAIASVDVTLNMDVVRTTSEEVLGGPGRGGQSAGVMVREREVVRDAAPPLDQRADGRTGNTQREIEYQTGRRVEQVVTQPGAIRRMQVVAVVSRPVDAQQLDQIRALVAAAVGLQPERGDAVVVQSLKALGTEPPVQATAAPATAAAPGAEGGALPVPAQESVAWPLWRGVAFVVVLAVLALLLWAARRGPRAGSRGLRVLPPAEREAALRQLQAWLQAEGAPALPAAAPGHAGPGGASHRAAGGSVS